MRKTPDGSLGNVSKSTTRRGFLQKSAIGALAIVGTRALAGCDGGTSVTGDLPGDTTGDTPGQITWSFDREADVVVIGSGTGLVAALVAAVKGAKVLVLEKSAATGGSTRLSGGVAWIPNNPVMKEAGIEDNRADALAYVRKMSKGQSEDALLEAFVDKGPEMVAFVGSQTDIGWQVTPLLGDYHTDWPGARFSGRSIGPTEGDAFNQGPILIDRLESAMKAAGGEVLLNAPAKKFITRTTPAGGLEIVGVEAEVDGARIRIRANQGVVLAAGGLDWDFERKRHFLRGPTEYTLGHPGNTGDGLRMAMAVGADLRNMNECWGGVVFAAETAAAMAEGKPANINAMAHRRMPGCITVNRYGERFCDEASPYDPAWLSFIRWENWGDLRDRNLPAFFISDKKMRPDTTVGVQKADTLRELAGLLSIDPDGLEATVAAFNLAALQGKDPIYHRGESAYEMGYGPTLAPIEKAPFYGVECAPADLGTCGGARVNVNAQVLDTDGLVIQRLYAAGNSSGVGGPGAGYGGGGGTIGPAMTFAYIAGGVVADQDRLVLEGDGASPVDGAAG
jgi:succinate dehydrogenase/fumarate reductase flavoprotein subunit